MYRLVFASMACEWLGWSDIGAFLGETRQQAARHDVTGLVLHDGRRFLFVVEGSFAATSMRYGSVRSDPRLTEVTLIESTPIAERSFAGWDGACQEVSTIQDARSLAAEVADLVEPVRDPALRRLLLGFVRPDAVTPGTGLPTRLTYRPASPPPQIVAANAPPLLLA